MWLEPTIEKRVLTVVEQAENDTIFSQHEKEFCDLFKKLSLILKERNEIDLLYQLESEVDHLIHAGAGFSYRSGLRDGMNLLHSAMTG
jgi:hypothetical protein